MPKVSWRRNESRQTPRGAGPVTSATYLGVAVAGFVAVAVYHLRTSVLSHPAAHWDEALHLLYAELLAESLRAGDLWALAYDCYRMSMWPPLHALLVGLAFASLGPSALVGRVAGLLFLTAGLAGLAALAHRLAPHPLGCSPAFAIALGAGCSPLLGLASQAMLEPLGALLLAVAFLSFDHDAARGSPRSSQAMLGAAVVATYLARLNYGLLLIAALGVEGMLSTRRDGWRTTLARRHVCVLVIAVFLAAWLSHPVKLRTTWTILVNSRFEPPPGAPSGPFFAPWALWTVLGTLALALVPLAWRSRSSAAGRATGRFLVVVAGLQLALLAAHQSQLVRHVLPAAIAIIPVLASAAAHASHELAARRGQRTASAASLSMLAMLAAGGLRRVEGAVPQPGAASVAAPRVAAAVAELVSREERFLLVIAAPHLESPGIDWSLVAQHGLLLPSRAGALGEEGRGAATLQLLDRLSAQGIPVEPLALAVRRSTAADRSRTVHIATLAAPEASALLSSLSVGSYPVLLVARRQESGRDSTALAAAVGSQCLDLTGSAASGDVVVDRYRNRCAADARKDFNRPTNERGRGHPLP
jgi:hypothetical protein